MYQYLQEQLRLLLDKVVLVLLDLDHHQQATAVTLNLVLLEIHGMH